MLITTQTISYALDEPKRVWYNTDMETNRNIFKEFECTFSDEQMCIDYLYNLRWKNGWKCPRCSHNEHWKVGDMKYKCKECGYQSTIISGTLLQRSHLPISKWLRSAWYVANETGCANALEMQNLIDLGSYHTALSVLNKLRKAISGCKKPKLKGTVIVDDVYIKSDNDGFSYHTFIAVEIKKNGYGQIRIELHSETDYFSFIRRNIVNGSTIQTKGLNIYAKVPDGYQLMVINKKSGSKMLPLIEDVVNEILDRRLLGGRQSSCSSSNYDLCLAECCFKFNRRNKKAESLFEEILHMANKMDTVNTD